MTIYIQNKNGKTDTWRLEERKTFIYAIDFIELIEVDGDELDEIRLRFDNIPLPKHRNTVIWRGEFARFIMENI